MQNPRFPPAERAGVEPGRVILLRTLFGACLFALAVLLAGAAGCVGGAPNGGEAERGDSGAAGSPSNGTTGNPSDGNTPSGDTATAGDSSSHPPADSALADAPSAPVADGSTEGGPSSSVDSGPSDPECSPSVGSPMLFLPSPSGRYCVDVREATNGDFAAFSKAPPTLSSLPDFCDWKLGFAAPSPDPAAVDLPIVNVDFCDVYAYCTWAGKSLCGGFDGGPVGDAGTGGLPNGTSDSQWLYACQNGAAQLDFPYGTAFDLSTCNVTNTSTQPLWTAATPTCRGKFSPFDRLVNMSGNVAEWEDGCASYSRGTKGNANCLVRGGSVGAGPQNSFDLGCKYQHYQYMKTQLPTLGFRCCKTLP